MESLDTVVLDVIGRHQMAEVMVLIDSLAALFCAYTAVFITWHFGFGSFEQRLQAGHRLAILFMSVCFAWHAEDIAEAPEAHGLALSNVCLHITIVIVTSMSAWRLKRASHFEEQMKKMHQEGNGGVIVGPFTGAGR